MIVSVKTGRRILLTLEYSSFILSLYFLLLDGKFRLWSVPNYFMVFVFFMIGTNCFFMVRTKMKIVFRLIFGVEMGFLKSSRRLDELAQ